MYEKLFEKHINGTTLYSYIKITDSECCPQALGVGGFNGYFVICEDNETVSGCD